MQLRTPLVHSAPLVFAEVALRELRHGGIRGAEQGNEVCQEAVVRPSSTSSQVRAQIVVARLRGWPFWVSLGRLLIKLQRSPRGARQTKIAVFPGPERGNRHRQGDRLEVLFASTWILEDHQDACAAPRVSQRTEHLRVVEKGGRVCARQRRNSKVAASYAAQRPVRCIPVELAVDRCKGILAHVHLRLSG
jgi:hypothetical protein